MGVPNKCEPVDGWVKKPQKNWTVGEQRYVLELLKNERARFKTFKNWTHRFIGAKELAAAGFVYFNRGDEVQCVFCLCIVDDWSYVDCVFEAHRRKNRWCRFIVGLPVGNIPDQDNIREFWENYLKENRKLKIEKNSG